MNKGNRISQLRDAISLANEYTFLQLKSIRAKHAEEFTDQERFVLNRALDVYIENESEGNLDTNKNTTNMHSEEIKIFSLEFGVDFILQTCVNQLELVDLKDMIVFSPDAYYYFTGRPAMYRDRLIEILSSCGATIRAKHFSTDRERKSIDRAYKALRFFMEKGVRVYIEDKSNLKSISPPLYDRLSDTNHYPQTNPTQ